MFGFKLFSPVTRVGTKDRLRRRLARDQAAHDQAIERLHGRIDFLNGQLREHREARQAVAAACVELDLDLTVVGREIETGLLEDASAPGPVINMTDVLRFADVREAAREDRA